VKTLVSREGHECASGEAVRGYEIHLGRTRGPGCDRPMLRLGAAADGAVSADGRVMGCYLHGLFAADRFRHAFLGRIRRREASRLGHEARVEAALDGLAAHLERWLDLDRLLAIARGPLRG
jgi:adenosylcobyric acid synthase